MTLRRRLASAVAAALVVAASPAAPIAYATPTFEGPFVTPERTDYSVGDTLVVTIGGFSANGVTVSICGNEAQRGSTDCNMAESEGVALDGLDVTTIAQMPVAAPPVGCPCIVRVVSSDGSEIAVAPITVAGHPDEPVVGPPSVDHPITVTVFAESAAHGLIDRLRASLGGDAKYDVTVTVKNRSTVELRGLTLTGSVGHDSTEIAQTLDLVAVSQLAPGQTAQQAVHTELPGPAFGDALWQVSVSGAGASGTARDTTFERPLTLIILIVVLIVDIIVLLVRFVIRRIRKIRNRPHDDDFPQDDFLSEHFDEPLLIG
jgi:sortase A